jgi:hypothetical protein
MIFKFIFVLLILLASFDVFGQSCDVDSECDPRSICMAVMENEGLRVCVIRDSRLETRNRFVNPDLLKHSLRDQTKLRDEAKIRQLEIAKLEAEVIGSQNRQITKPSISNAAFQNIIRSEFQSEQMRIAKAETAARNLLALIVESENKERRETLLESYDKILSEFISQRDQLVGRVIARSREFNIQ